MPPTMMTEPIQSRAIRPSAKGTVGDLRRSIGTRTRRDSTSKGRFIQTDTSCYYKGRVMG